MAGIGFEYRESSLIEQPYQFGRDRYSRVLKSPSHVDLAVTVTPL
jgi:hypothetical protein